MRCAPSRQAGVVQDYLLSAMRFVAMGSREALRRVMMVGVSEEMDVRQSVYSSQGGPAQDHLQPAKTSVVMACSIP